MISRDMSKSEIDRELEGKGEYVQIDMLNRFLEDKPGILTKKYVYTKLAQIYQKKKMFRDVGKTYDSLGINSVAFTDKVKYFLLAAEFYIKDGAFGQADLSVKRAMQEANSYERGEIYHSIKQFYKNQAKEYEANLKFSKASQIYEKLGKFKEYNILSKKQ